MRRLAALALVLVAVVARAEWVEIADFSSGLNTVKTSRRMQPGEARVCHNLDLNDAPGGLVVRSGYEYIMTVPGLDSLLWNQPMVVQYSDGSKEMLLVGDTAGVGYANIYRSERNSLDFGTLDTFRLVPLVQVVQDSAAVFGVDTARWSVVTRIMGGATCTLTVTLDTGTAAADVVDTLIALFEATACTTCFNAARSGDTLVLAEIGNDVLSQLTLGATLYRPNVARSSFKYAPAKAWVKSYGSTDSLRFAVYQYYPDYGWGLETVTLTVDTADYTREEIVDSLAVIYYPGEWTADTATHTDSTLTVEYWGWNNTATTHLRVYGFSATGPPPGGWTRIYSAEYSTWYAGDAEWHTVDAWDSTSHSSIAPDRIATYFAATGTPQMAMYQDKAYLVNGVGRGLVYNGRLGSPFPAQAAGELLAVPLTDPGTLSGRYRYCIRARGDSVTHADTLITNRWGYLSQPVIVNSGKVLLYGFPRRTYDWRYTGGDSITYEIWRTVGSVGQLDKLDSIWNTGLTIHIDSANYAAATITDTLSDATLRTKAGKVFVDGEMYRWANSITDTGKYTYYRRPGAVGLDSVKSTLGSTIWTSGDSTVDWEVCAGFSVMVVAIDTTQDIPADSGVSWNFFQWSEAVANDRDTNSFGDNVGFIRDSVEVLKYILPRPADDDIMYLVYRGPVQPTAVKTARHIWLGGTYPHWTITRIDVIQYATEFFVPEYYLVGLFNAGDTVEDRISYDSLSAASEEYKRNAIPAVANAIATFDRRLFITDGSYIQYSNDPYVDSTGRFLTFNRIGVNPDDGDRITAMWAQTGVMRVAKNRSMYNVFKNAAGEYGSIELADHYGVVAALSHVSAPEGDWFLSGDGVRLEDEGIYKERSFIGSLMSSQIRGLIQQPIAALRNSVAGYYGSAYLLSIPALDTTLVCFKIPTDGGQYRYSWATWDLVFSGAAYYSVSAENVLTPADSLYFTQPGGSSLYRFGSSATDDGDTIVAVWESGPLGPMDGDLWEPSKVGVWAESADTVTGAVAVRFYNDQYDTAAGRWGALDTGKTVTMPGLRERRYHLFEVAPGTMANDVLYWSADLRVAGVQTVGDETVVEGLKVELTNRGPAQRR